MTRRARAEHPSAPRQAHGTRSLGRHVRRPVDGARESVCSVRRHQLKCSRPREGSLELTGSGIRPAPFFMPAWPPPATAACPCATSVPRRACSAASVRARSTTGAACTAVAGTPSTSRQHGVASTECGWRASRDADPGEQSGWHDDSRRQRAIVLRPGSAADLRSVRTRGTTTRARSARGRGHAGPSRRLHRRRRSWAALRCNGHRHVLRMHRVRTTRAGAPVFSHGRLPPCHGLPLVRRRLRPRPRAAPTKARRVDRAMGWSRIERRAAERRRPYRGHRLTTRVSRTVVDLPQSPTARRVAVVGRRCMPRQSTSDPEAPPTTQDGLVAAWERALPFRGHRARGWSSISRMGERELALESVSRAEHATRSVARSRICSGRSPMRTGSSAMSTSVAGVRGRRRGGRRREVSRCGVPSRPHPPSRSCSTRSIREDRLRALWPTRRPLALGDGCGSRARFARSTLVAAALPMDVRGCPWSVVRRFGVTAAARAVAQTCRTQPQTAVRKAGTAGGERHAGRDTPGLQAGGYCGKLV